MKWVQFIRSCRFHNSSAMRTTKGVNFVDYNLVLSETKGSTWRWACPDVPRDNNNYESLHEWPQSSKHDQVQQALTISIFDFRSHWLRFATLELNVTSVVTRRSTWMNTHLVAPCRRLLWFSIIEWKVMNSREKNGQFLARPAVTEFYFSVVYNRYLSYNRQLDLRSVSCWLIVLWSIIGQNTINYLLSVADGELR